MSDYPRTAGTRIVWACCESTTGPTCEHLPHGLTRGQLDEARGWFQDVGTDAPLTPWRIIAGLDAMYYGGAAAFANDTKWL